ncbi:MAG: hypothetical protein WBA43_04290 [Elainellaceae cyanobacterium]
MMTQTIPARARQSLSTGDRPQPQHWRSPKASALAIAILSDTSSMHLRVFLHLKLMSKQYDCLAAIHP